MVYTPWLSCSVQTEVIGGLFHCRSLIKFDGPGEWLELTQKVPFSLFYCYGRLVITVNYILLSPTLSRASRPGTTTTSSMKHHRHEVFHRMRFTYWLTKSDNDIPICHQIDQIILVPFKLTYLEKTWFNLMYHSRQSVLSNRPLQTFSV